MAATTNLSFAAVWWSTNHLLGRFAADSEGSSEEEDDGIRPGSSGVVKKKPPTPKQDPTPAREFQWPPPMPECWCLLCIHSNFGAGGSAQDPRVGFGHAWLSLHCNSGGNWGTPTTYGLWPDGHPSTPDNGEGSDVRENHHETGPSHIVSALPVMRQTSSHLSQNLLATMVVAFLSAPYKTVRTIWGPLNPLNPGEWVDPFSPPRPLGRTPEIGPARGPIGTPQPWY